MHHDRIDPVPGHDLASVSGPIRTLALDGDVEPARRLRAFRVAREVRHIEVEPVELRQDGPLLVGELRDMLLIMPVENLVSETNSRSFGEALLRQAGRKPNIVIELNQQGRIPTDSLMPPLLDLCRGCKERSRVIIAIRDEWTNQKFAQMGVSQIATIVASGQAAIELIDLEYFMAQRDIERRSASAITPCDKV